MTWGSNHYLGGCLLLEHSFLLCSWRHQCHFSDHGRQGSSITTEADSYGVTVLDALKAAGLRAGVDLRNEKINYKVREHSVSKIPVILAVGGREAEGQTVSMRRLGSKESQVLSLGEAVQILSDEATPPDLRA